MPESDQPAPTDEASSSVTPSTDVFFRSSLSRILLFWFLVLSLLPLGLVCFIGYQQSTQALRASAINRLNDDAIQQAIFIDHWFSYRFKGLRAQAEDNDNAQFMKALTEGLKTSGQAAGDYVGSPHWVSLVEANKADLEQLMQIYSYYYDLFLIDLHGNILFSVRGESDLGTNLFSGPYKSSNFAKIVRESLNNGKDLFSDLEHYTPSDNAVAGFLSAPLLDDNGEKVGVFAAELKKQAITELTTSVSSKNVSQVSYLVGEDLLSRTAIRSVDDVLARKIETPQTELWLKERDHAQYEQNNDDVVFDYIGPFGQRVLGVHHTVKIGDVAWGLIAEVDEAEALAPAQWMAKVTLMILLILLLSVVAVAFFVSRRITQPLKALVNSSQRASKGQLDQQVEIPPVEEMAQLGHAFNTMLESRRHYEAELTASNEKTFKALLELEEQKHALDQHALVSITDTEGIITFANEKFRAISGYSLKELLGKDHRILNSSHHPSTFFQQIYQTLNRGEVWHGEICNKNKNGSFYWVDSTIVPFVDEHGVITKYVAISTDISARKQAELSSANSLAIVEATLEATDNGIIVFNQFDKAIHYNQRLLELWQLTQEQVLFGDVNSILNAVRGQLAEGDNLVDIVQGIQSGENPSSSGVVNFIDGHILEYSSRELCLPDDKKGQVWSFNDITAQTHAAVELTRAKEVAEQATIAKGDFLANMSHEIRTPMNGVLGMLNLLSNTELSSKQSYQVRLARSSGEALLVLINDILDFSKIEAGKLELESIDFDLHLLIVDLAESMALQAQSKDLEIVLDLAQIESPRVKGDPTRIRQMLTNLVGNALKFTHEGEIVIRAALEIKALGELTLTVSVTDTGIGIPPDKVEHLFDSFSQVDASTTRQFGGTGLGLSIVKNLCELMNGKVVVTSELGEGSCFTITLPLAPSETEAIVKPTIDLSGVRILIVDDNATNRKVLHGQLSLWGAVVTEADSGVHALAVLEEQVREPFPVAIIDMQMPEMDGAALGRAIRADERFKTTALIMMTSMNEPGDAQFFADLGFSACFPKPTTTSDLFDALAIVLEGGEALKSATPLVTHNYLQSFEAADAGENKQPPSTSSQFRLLLAEDNVINQLVAVGLLEGMGYVADIADNGAQAIMMLQDAPADAPYQLVLMDCQMPLLDGYEATVKIRNGEAGQRYCDMTIIAMTANVMAGDREKCLQTGMDDYIAKPIDPEQLEKRLTHYLRLASDRVSLTAASETSDELLKSDEMHTEDTVSEKQVWDREDLLKRLRSNEALLLSLLQQFLQDMPKQMKELQQAVANTDFVRVASLAHSLKGVVGNLSGQRLFTLAVAMELAGGQKDKQEIEELWPPLLSEYEGLYEILKGYLDEQQASSNGGDEVHLSRQGEAESSPLKEQVAELRAKLRDGHFVDSEDLAYLIPYCEQDPEKTLLTTLRTQLAEFDLEAGVLTLDAIQKSLEQN